MTTATPEPISLDTIARLQDIRLRIANRERIGAEEMRLLLDDIRHDRESAQRIAARSRRAADKAVSSSATPPLTLTDLFGPKP